MPWRIVFKTSTLDFIRSLPKESRRRIGQGLRCLELNPFASRAGCDIKRLRGTQGREDAYRLRIGPWRAVYVVRDGFVEVRVFDWRDKVYDF